MDSPPQVATRSFQNEPLPPQFATRSFENEPHPDTLPQVAAQRRGPKRKRGITALLDVTNTVLPDNQKRACSEKTSTRLAKQLARKAPRADPSKATPARMTNAAVRENSESAEQTVQCSTLCRLIKNRPSVLNCGGECINGFLERNTTFETQKAFALHIFATAVRVDGAGILAATAEAAKYTGFSSEKSSDGGL